jgi:hypothetical protein
VAAEAHAVIASRLGLVALALASVTLALVLTFGGAAPRTVDRALFPGFDPAQVTAIRWAGAGHDVAVARSPNGWTVAAVPPRGDGTISADAATVADVLAALRGASWHRREDDARVAGPTRVTVSLSGGRDDSFAIAAEIPGADQAWIVNAERAYLVDGWVVRALAPDPLELHVRWPLAGAASAQILEVGELRIEGDPPRMGALRLDRELVRALVNAVAALEVVALAPGPTGELDPVDRVTVATADVSIAPVGACGPDRVFVAGTTGPGCVARAQWRAILDAAAALHGPADRIVDRHPLASDPRRIVLPGGAVIDRSRRPQIDGRDADPDRVKELVDALEAAAQPVPRPTTPAIGSISADALVLEIYDHVVARPGEPIALSTSSEAWAAIQRPASAYRDPTRWVEEPTTITEIAIDGVRHQRGAVVGEWTSAADPSLVETAVIAIATLRAPFGPAPVAVAHRVEVVVTPPAGPKITHHLELGPITNSGCSGRADGEPVVVPLAICTAITAAAR